MRLIYIHQHFRFPEQSGGTRSYDLAMGFSKNGIDVEIITATSDIQYKNVNWGLIERDGMKVHLTYLPYDNSFSYLKRVFVFIKFLWLSTLKALKLKGDLILATSTPLTIGIPALINKWWRGTPFIFEVRDVWPEAVIAIGAIKNKYVQRLLYKLEFVIYANAKAIIPLSVDMKSSIVRRFPELDKKITVIENISELNRFQNIRDKIDLEKEIGFKPRFSVLYAGTFGKVNGVHNFVNLAEHTFRLDPHLVYILMGNGAEYLEVIELSKRKGLYNKNIFFPMSVAKDQLSSWYAVVDMGSSFVIDVEALWANSANKFFDTLAAGKSILINHGGWQSKVIEESNIGYVLPTNITESDAQEFVKYSNNIENLIIQKNNALQVAKANYSLEVAIKRYLIVIKSIYL